MSIDCQNETPGIYRQVIHVDAHTMYADVKPESGGQGSAPSPHDHFDAALASCKALTAMMYAKTRGYALERVEAHVERDASREREGHYVLRVKLAFFGGLSDAEKQKIHDAITRCPIHKLMTTAEIEIQTEPLTSS